MNKPSPQPVRLLSASFPGDAYLETAFSAALMRQVARAELPPSMRLNRTGPILAFGKLDRLRPGYRRAVAIAREAGYAPVERIAGGRAAVFSPGTISLSHAIRAGGASGSYAGTMERFASAAELIAAAVRDLGADARIGAVPGEYCPGEYSVNARGEAKLAGIGQRVIVGGAHVGAVVVVRGATAVNEVLVPVYEALELDFDPAATGSLATELGMDDDPIPLDREDPLIDRLAGAIRAQAEQRYGLVEASPDASTIRLAEELEREYVPRIG